MEHEGTLPCSKDTVNGPYREPDESSLHLRSLYLYDLF